MTLVRLLTVLSILIPGPQVIFYVIGWILIPAERTASASQPTA